MNYNRFKDDLRAFGDTLAEHGIPVAAIEEILNFAEQAGVIAETKARNDRQFEMQYREYGPTTMGKRLGISRQAARKRFNRIIAEPKLVFTVSAQG